MSLRLLIPVALMLLLSAIGNLWQFSQITDLHTQAGKDQQKTTTQTETITQLTANAVARANVQVQLQNKQATLLQLNTQQQTEIQRLKDENETYRAWFDTDLPDVARRLQQRPAIIGPDQLREYLSHRNALHTEPSQSNQERSPAAGQSTNPDRLGTLRGTSPSHLPMPAGATQ